MAFGWCSDLESNSLMGSVPSSLSALTNLETLCETPRAAPCLCMVAVHTPIGSCSNESVGAVEGACRRIPRAVQQKACCSTHRETLWYSQGLVCLSAISKENLPGLRVLATPIP